VALTCSILALLIGCEHAPGWLDTSSWFGKSNVDQNAAYAHPGFGKGPLAPPQPAPVSAVQATPLPVPQSTVNHAAPAVAATTPAVPAPASAAKTKVAILLPLTGKSAALGQAMLNAAQQAVFDSADTRFELMPRDTGTTDAGAEAAARDAIASGAQLLIGPLFGANVPAVHAIAQTSGINMLTLSTDTSLAAPGVYVMGFAPGAQVERVVTFAISHGLRHFAALLPKNAYGTLVGAAFQEAVTSHGGVLVSIEAYDPTKHDSAGPIQRLASKRDQIDALFLPEGGSDLSQIAGQLVSTGFDNHRIRLIGTGLWDVPDLARQSNFLISGWYAASDPSARRNFISGYNATYSGEPPRLATLAYDATAMAAVLSKRGAPFDTAELTNPNGFAGLDGIFRLTPQGLVERGLAINEVTPEGAHVVDAAPTTFAGN